MGKVCCVCKTKRKVSVWRFPKNENHRERWIKYIPNHQELKVNDETTLCRLHWPQDLLLIKKNGKWRPKDEDAPTIFEGFLPSEIPSKPPPLRKTSRSSFEARTTMPDQMEEFLNNDVFSYDQLKDTLVVNRKQLLPPAPPVNAFMVGDSIYIQSQNIAIICVKNFA